MAEPPRGVLLVLILLLAWTRTMAQALLSMRVLPAHVPQVLFLEPRQRRFASREARKAKDEGGQSSGSGQKRRCVEAIHLEDLRDED